MPDSRFSETDRARGLIFDLRRFSLHDGPGIRTTVFLKGCALSCLWCHNPESQSRRTEVFYRIERCILCGQCLEACPQGANAREGARVVTDSGRCTRCGVCGMVCPAEAREVVGRWIGVEEVLTEVEKDRLFYDQSGGGVTFSGGEPLLQPRFLLACLEECGARGLHRAVDTAGFVQRGTLQRVASECDLFLYDLKHMNSEIHRKLTGVPNEAIRENLVWLVEQGKRVEVRIPLIGGCNDDDWNLRETARFLRGLECRPPVSLLPFHPAAREKHRRFGVPYRLEEGGGVPSERVEEILAVFTDSGLAVSLGGS